MTPERITFDVVQDAMRDPEILWDYFLFLSDKLLKTDRSEDGYLALVESLPKGLKLNYYLVRFDSDVLNGGIRQFFHNHTPWEVQQVIDSLETIGAVESAKLIQLAIPVYETLTEWERGSRERICPPSWQDPDYMAEPPLNLIDDVRCSNEASYRDYGLLIEYMRKHPEQFLHG